MQLSFSPYHTTVVLEARGDASRSQACLAGCSSLLLSSSLLLPPPSLLVAIADCEGLMLLNLSPSSSLDTLLSSLHSYCHQRIIPPRSPALLLDLVTSQLPPPPAPHAAALLIWCLSSPPPPSSSCLVVRSLTPAALTSCALLHHGVAQLLLRRVPTSLPAVSAQVSLWCGLGHHRLLCSLSSPPPEHLLWSNVSSSCLSWPYQCAHLAREIGSSLVTAALRDTPTAGVLLVAEGGGAGRLLHWSSRHSALVVRCLLPRSVGSDVDDSANEKRLLQCCTGVPASLVRVLWGSDAVVGDEDAAAVRAKLLACRESLSWPQLVNAPLSHLTASRALFALFARRITACPALLPLASGLPPDLRPESAPPLPVAVAPAAPAFRGGALYAGLGLTSRPRFGGKDGE